METLVFGGATEAAITRGRAQLKREFGIDLTGDVGQVKKMGTTATFTWDRAAEQLTVTVKGAFEGRGKKEVRKHLAAIGLQERA